MTIVCAEITYFKHIVSKRKKIKNSNIFQMHIFEFHEIIKIVEA